MDQQSRQLALRAYYSIFYTVLLLDTYLVFLLTFQRFSSTSVCCPKIRQFTIYYAGLLGRWSKQIINQASYFLSIIYIHHFLDLEHTAV